MKKLIRISLFLFAPAFTLGGCSFSSWDENLANQGGFYKHSTVTVEAQGKLWKHDVYQSKADANSWMARNHDMDWNRDSASHASQNIRAIEKASGCKVLPTSINFYVLESKAIVEC